MQLLFVSQILDEFTAAKYPLIVTFQSLSRDRFTLTTAQSVTGQIVAQPKRYAILDKLPVLVYCNFFSLSEMAEDTLQAKWTIVSYSVTPSAGSGSSTAPNAPQQVESGQTTSFTVTADPGYGILAASGCNGTLNGSVFTTGTITANCTITVYAMRHSGTSGSGTPPTLTDALKALQAYNGSVTLTPQERVIYDVAPLATNGIPLGDGLVDIFDVFLILRRTIGIGYW